MKQGRFILYYVLLLIAQILLCNYFGLSRYVLVSVLPVMILLLPRGMNVVVTMLIAFITGFAVDFFSTGMLGITSFALVPVALTRGLFIGMVFGEDVSSRDEELSISRMGLPRMLLAIILTCALFFMLYVWVDSAGTVRFWRAFLRFLLSVLVSTPVCAYVSRLLRPE